MRPPRLVLLLACFVALPVFLTFFSLFYSFSTRQQPTESSAPAQKNGLRALFSFRPPTSLFPPSAIISLTDDNSTFFLARPAAFGPTLPADGLSGRLWVGSGFGDDDLGRGGIISGAEGELGCSDIPGWVGGKPASLGDKHGGGLVNGKSAAGTKGSSSQDDQAHKRRSTADVKGRTDTDITVSVPNDEDGTDDHLHHPLPDSSMANPKNLGRPAKSDSSKGSQPPPHADIQSLQESAEIAGKVVLLSRGGCGFLEKVKWVQRRGGVALIVGDDTKGGPLIIMYAHGDTSNVTIPSLFTSHTTAHLLSSLIPPEGPPDDTTSEDGFKASPGEGRSRTGGAKKKSGKKAKGADTGPAFTTTVALRKPTTTPQPISASKPGNHGSQSSVDTSKKAKAKSGWLRSLGSSLGLGAGDSSDEPNDSRRPPSSGRLNWIVSDDWEDEPVLPKNNALAKGKKTTSKDAAKSGLQLTDDFIIGVQDWRDPDLVNHGPKDAVGKGKNGPNTATTSSSTTATATKGKQTGTGKKEGKAFAGGNTTPGSGEYDTSGSPADSIKSSEFSDEKKHQGGGWLGSFWGSEQEKGPSSTSQEAQAVYKKKIAPHFVEETEFDDEDELDEWNGHEGLWVTMTPTTMSSSPFFDTLLVLVVSPLVTLTVVYALLLLRSRIRRRRWRAPKSVVDRLPVRTYYTMSSPSNATTSQIATSPTVSPTTPLLQASPTSITRTRPRSRTTSGIEADVAASLDKATARAFLARDDKLGKKRYTGKQVECVVCLEEYIDGQSRVMSLPCGHEFHAECITPWLTTRRRTCPICKGDVVRSLASNPTPSPNRAQSPPRHSYHDLGDEYQDEAAETVNDSPSSAIPIPRASEDDADLEQGDQEDMAATLINDRVDSFSPRRGWRALTSLSLSAFTGEATWMQTQADRADRTR